MASRVPPPSCVREANIIMAEDQALDYESLPQDDHQHLPVELGNALVHYQVGLNVSHHARPDEKGNGRLVEPAHGALAHSAPRHTSRATDLNVQTFANLLKCWEARGSSAADAALRPRPLTSELMLGENFNGSVDPLAANRMEELGSVPGSALCIRQLEAGKFSLDISDVANKTKLHSAQQLLWNQMANVIEEMPRHVFRSFK